MTKREYKNLTDPSSSWICMTCICPLSAYSFDGSKSIDNTDQTMDTCKNSFDGEPEIRMLRGFKIAHLNINRIVNKLDHVKELVQKYSFDILTLSETWLTPNIMDNEISIPGYVLVRKDRQSLSKTCGGGVRIYIREGIPFVVNSNFVNDNLEFLWVEVRRPKCKRMTLFCCYRPGDENIDDFISYIDDTLSDIDTENCDFVLTGDINVDYSGKKIHCAVNLTNLHLNTTFLKLFQSLLA